MQSEPLRCDFGPIDEQGRRLCRVCGYVFYPVKPHEWVSLLCPGAPPPVPSPEPSNQFPCAHRGEPLRTDVAEIICPDVGKFATVFRCALPQIGECCIREYRYNNRGPRECKSCSLRVEPTTAQEPIDVAPADNAMRCEMQPQPDGSFFCSNCRRSFAKPMQLDCPAKFGQVMAAAVAPPIELPTLRITGPAPPMQPPPPLLDAGQVPRPGVAPPALPIVAAEPAPKAKECLILQTGLPPGDLMTLTAAIESLHATYPGEYLTDVRTGSPAIWAGNPHITPLDERVARVVEMHYPSLNRSSQATVPFLEGYTEFLGEQIGRPLRLTVNRPHIYLTADEKRWLNQVQEISKKPIPFWIMNAGVKRDYTCKQWPIEHYQEVIDRTRGLIQWVQVGQPSDVHAPLNGCINLVGKTSDQPGEAAGEGMRRLIRLVYHCRGAIGPVTFLQHLAAAFEKPYLCLLGGRESTTWVQYPLQQTFHSIGALPCCRSTACWKSRVVALNDGDSKDQSLCEQPRLGGLQPFPACMGEIMPGEVVAVLQRLVSQLGRS